MKNTKLLKKKTKYLLLSLKTISTSLSLYKLQGVRFRELAGPNGNGLHMPIGVQRLVDASETTPRNINRQVQRKDIAKQNVKPTSDVNAGRRQRHAAGIQIGANRRTNDPTGR